MVITANPKAGPASNGKPSVLSSKSPLLGTIPNTESSAFDKLNVLGAATVTDTVAALGVAASQACGADTPVLNFAMAGVHGLRSLAFLAGARGKSGVQLQQRLGVGLGEGLMATGNVLAGLGQATWSIPVLLAGAGLNLVADYRYRSAHEDDPGQSPKPSWSSGQKVLNIGDAVLTFTVLAPETALFGGGLGAITHLGLAAGCYAGKGGIAAPNTHSQHSKGYAHAMIAAGMIAGAAGAGPWMLVPVLAGALGTNLQDLRDSTLK